MKYHYVLLIVIMFVLTSCQTLVDNETGKSERLPASMKPLDPPKAKAKPTASPGASTVSANEKSEEADGQQIVITPVYIKQPIFYPMDQFEEVNEAIKKSTMDEKIKKAIIESEKTPKDWNGAIQYFDYDPSFGYKIFAKTGYMVEIVLQAGESTIGKAMLTDEDNWVFKNQPGANGEIHFYLVPKRDGLETELFVNTNRRTYYFLLRSLKDMGFRSVRFNYPLDKIQPEESVDAENPYASWATKGPATAMAGDQEVVADSGFGIERLPSNPFAKINPFGYSWSYFTDKPPYWLPYLVFDNGAKTYIVLNPGNVHREIPTVNLNDYDVLNYRWIRFNIVEIDRLVNRITLRLNGQSVVITRKEEE